MASISITSHPSSVDPSSNFDVSGSFAGCDSPTVTATMNGQALTVSTPSVSGGTWDVVITSGACDPEGDNIIYVVAKCGNATPATTPISVNCTEDGGDDSEDSEETEEAADSDGGAPEGAVERSEVPPAKPRNGAGGEG